MNRLLVLLLGALAASRPGVRDFFAAEVRPRVETARIDALETLVERAYESSPRLERSRAGAAAAAAGARKARSALLPRLAFQQRFSSTNQPSAAFGALLEQGRIDPERFASLAEPERVENWAATLSAEMLLFDSGVTWSAWSAASEDAERAELDAEDMKRRVRFEVASAFYDVLRARARIRVAEETIRSLEARHAAAQARFEVGQVLRADLLAVEVRLGEAREGRVSARYAAEIALAVLAEATGGVSSDEVDVPPIELALPRYQGSPSRVVERALASHPRLAGLAHARAGAEAALRAASLARLPRLRGEIAGRWNGDDETFGLDRESYVGGVVLELPLFEGGRIAAEEGAAAARLREAVAAEREAKATIELEVRRADRRAREMVALAALADRGARAAEEALEVLAARYDRGMVPLETLLEIERDRSRARARSVEARAGAAIALEAVRLLAGEETLR